MPIYNGINVRLKGIVNIMVFLEGNAQNDHPEKIKRADLSHEKSKTGSAVGL